MTKHIFLRKALSMLLVCAFLLTNLITVSATPISELVPTPVTNEQTAMPEELDSSNSLVLAEQGQRLFFEHANTNAQLNGLSGFGFYTIAERSDNITIEADITVSSVGIENSDGIYIGMFDNGVNISKMAALGIKGNGKINNLYNVAGSASPASGGIDMTYNTDDTIHVLVKRTADGWHSEVTTDGKTASGDITSENTDILTGTEVSVRYGFAFANVTGIIKNLKITDSANTVIYDQNDCYEAIGTAPVISAVEAPVVASDSSTVTVSWQGTIAQTTNTTCLSFRQTAEKHFPCLQKS